jgi:hypothetical protein
MPKTDIVVDLSAPPPLHGEEDPDRHGDRARLGG